MQDGLRNEFPYGKCQTVSAKLRIMNLKKVLDKMPQYLLLLKIAFSCQIRTLHLMVLELEQCCCSEQKINQVAMIKSAVIVKVMRNIHTDYHFLKEISCEF